ncbi:MAG TPA: hypothetical protein VH701_14855 [Vicinamibacterales bacterium]|jgi:hypothetical protein
MRTLIKVTVPVEAGNRAIRDGSLPKVISDSLERLRPEAAYFLPDRGIRTMMLVIDVKDPSDIPVIAEPFFTQLDAAVEFTPVMNADDVKKGLEKIVKR